MIIVRRSQINKASLFRAFVDKLKAKQKPINYFSAKTKQKLFSLFCVH